MPIRAPYDPRSRSIAWLLACGCSSSPQPWPVAPSGLPIDAPTINDTYARPRTTVDMPDELAGPQLHVLYVEPSDREAAPALDTNGTLRKTVTSFQAWLALHLGSKFRVDMYQGAIDVTHVKLAVTEMDMALGTTVAPAGPGLIQARFNNVLRDRFNDPNKMYLIFYDGLVLASCGASNRPDHMPGVYIGGVWQTSLLTAAAPAGATSLTVYDPVLTKLPAPPFAATLGGEAVSVTSINEATVQLAAPLRSAHAIGALLAPNSRPQDCRLNPFSRDGVEFGYTAFVGLHEVMHALGFVANGALDFAPPPIAGGHLHANTPAGTEDLMYQGTASGVFQASCRKKLCSGFHVASRSFGIEGHFADRCPVADVTRPT